MLTDKEIRRYAIIKVLMKPERIANAHFRNGREAIKREPMCYIDDCSPSQIPGILLDVRNLDKGVIIYFMCHRHAAESNYLNRPEVWKWIPLYENQKFNE